MAYKYSSRRYARRVAKKSRRNFIITLLLIGFLLYATLQWILPNLIGGIGFINNKIKPSQKIVNSADSDPSIAPPVLNIPYEATNTAQINIRGYGTPHSNVEIFLEDEKKDSTSVSDDGTFEIKDLTLALGTNNIYGKSADDKGKESLPSKTIKLIFDNEKPSLEVTEPEDGKKIQGGDKKINIAGKSEINAQVLINDSQVVLDKDGKFTTQLPLNDGDNNFDIKAIDSAGNTTEIARKVTYQP